jgi:hypothetical protein
MKIMNIMNTFVLSVSMLMEAQLNMIIGESSSS